MADLSNLARPYAQAIFELAQESDTLKEWGERLDLLAGIAADPTMEQLLKNPNFDGEAQVTLFLEIAGKRLDDETKNLVRLLVKNDRINALPSIASLYTLKQADAERVIEADMITASDIEPDQQAAFTVALEKQLGRYVQLTFSVDESLLGGAVIRAGDWVIDGSVKAQLEQLVGTVSA